MLWAAQGHAIVTPGFRGDLIGRHYNMGFQIVEKSVLRIWKYALLPGGLADHYYLATHARSRNQLGWGPRGIELKGTVKVTTEERDRVNRFAQAARYNLSVHNCEHFANYVLHGLPHSSQMYLYSKQLGADVLAMLLPAQSIRENRALLVGRLSSESLQENLRQVKIQRANDSRIAFWNARGVDLDGQSPPEQNGA